MEDILKQILSKLDSMDGNIQELKSNVSTLKSDVSTLKSDVSTLKSDVSELKADVKEIDRKTSLIFDQTAGLTEFQTHTSESLARIENELKDVEIVTAQNCYDITRLKAIK